ncbi:MAG: hypothetical protein WC628_09665 [Candidatus Omnitrophota bacterium]
MNRNAKCIIPVLALVLILTGCATWQYMDKGMPWKCSYFEASLPVGWVKFNTPFTHLLFLTKDGILLQRITLSKRDTGKELKFSKKKISGDMLIHDIAGIIVDELSLNQDFKNLQILENKPADITGIDGFKIIYEFNNADFVKYKSITYGFIIQKQYYELEYTAAKQYYFDRDLADFSAFFSNFKINKESAAKPVTPPKL